MKRSSALRTHVPYEMKGCVRNLLCLKERRKTHVSVNVARHLTVQVQHHVDLLHFRKHLIVHSVSLHSDTTLTVGRDSARVRLDTDDAALLGFADVSRSKLGGEVEGGEDVEVRSDGSELFGVGESVRRKGERRDEVGLFPYTLVSFAVLAERLSRRTMTNAILTPPCST
jgi:hypothetical protein